MYKYLHNRFRQDLIITQITKKDTLIKSYLVKEPTSGETFEFGEEEYFLCQSMNGSLTPTQILADFKSRFGLSMAEENFNDFSSQIASFGLLESLRSQRESPASVSLGNKETFYSENIPDLTKTWEEEILVSEPQKNKQNKKGKTYLWLLPNSERFFGIATFILKPFRIFFVLLTWVIIFISVPLALLTFLNNQSILWQDFQRFEEIVSFLLLYLVDLSLSSLIARIAQGVVLTYYGGIVKNFGIMPVFGFYPHFYINKENVWQFKRSQQLWIFGTPLITRIVLFVLGILIWYWNRGTGNQLGKWALLLAHAGFAAFLIDGCPLLPVDGLWFMIAYFRLPPNFLGRVYLVWEMVLNRRSLPESLSFKERLGLLLYGLAALIFWLLLILVFVFGTANGLTSSFGEIFGLGTGAIITTIFLVVALRQPIAMLWRMRKPKITYERSYEVEEYVTTKKSVIRVNKPGYWINKLIQIVFLIGLVLLLSLPYPYRPGGQIQLLPPTQQQIQAPVDGQITQVFFKGGDSTWIKTGTLVAIMEATNIQNDVLTAQEKVRNQQAILARFQDNLNKLLNTPRKEQVEVAQQEIEVAKQQVEVARQDVEVTKEEIEVAQKQLEAAISRAEYSNIEASRYEMLAREGAVSRQAYEDKKKPSETDRLSVEESRKNLLVKQKQLQSSIKQLAASEKNVQEKQANLQLVLSGAHPDDIAAARKDVEAARAEVKRLEQELKYNKEQLQRTKLFMPIDGYLVTPYLDQKVGSYLERGNMFAVCENDRHIRGEAKVPEYNAGEFAVGAQVEVKLAAYPDVSFIGKVIAIEPTAASDSSAVSSTGDHTSTNSNDRIIRVIVDLPNIDRVLKAGLTGYAKIEGSEKPVIVAFTRPIVRYIQLEVWSWLP